MSQGMKLIGFNSLIQFNFMLSNTKRTIIYVIEIAVNSRLHGECNGLDSYQRFGQSELRNNKAESRGVCLKYLCAKTPANPAGYNH